MRAFIHKFQRERKITIWHFEDRRRRKRLPLSFSFAFEPRKSFSFFQNLRKQRGKRFKCFKYESVHVETQVLALLDGRRLFKFYRPEKFFLLFNFARVSRRLAKGQQTICGSGHFGKNLHYSRFATKYVSSSYYNGDVEPRSNGLKVC